MTCGNFIYSVLPSCNENKTGCYYNDQLILNHTAEVPYQYRILALYMISLVASPTNESAWFTTALIIHLASFVVIYTSLYGWVRRWGSDTSALAALILMALVATP